MINPIVTLKTFVEVVLKKRLDQWLVELDLAPTRSKAQEIIKSRKVLVAEKVTDSAGFKLSVEDARKIKIVDHELLQFVSRGGLKLNAALDHLSLSVVGWRVLDVGSSTGGFGDCLLQRGAKEVIGIDVGHGQLAEKLRMDFRHKNFEGINARQLNFYEALQPILSEGFDLIVVDVSFVSLTQVISQVLKYLRQKGAVLALVKPQFELNEKNLNKRGVVKDEKLYAEVKNKIQSTFENEGLTVQEYFASEWMGKDGNREFFIYAEKL